MLSPRTCSVWGADRISSTSRISFAIPLMTIFSLCSTKIMTQLTVFNEDNSCADIILVSDTFYDELKRILEADKIEKFDLSFVKEIYLSRVESKKNQSFNCSSELLDVIYRIEDNLPNYYSLTICLSE